MCVEKYPSLSLVQPVLTALLKKHLVTADTDPDITVQLKTAIADNLKAHFLDKKQREFALLASAVDPRYKSLKFLDSSERGAVFRILVIGNDSNEQVEDTVSTAKQLKAVEEDILDYAASSGSSGSNSPNDSRLSNIIEKEVFLYCSDDEIDHGDDPLEWWRLTYLSLLVVCYAYRLLLYRHNNYSALLET